MSQSPSDILQRLKQLKLWQESQEELLKKAKSLVDPGANVTTASDYQTIEGLSDFDTTSEENSPKKSRNIDNEVISPTKSFHELLEEKIAQDPGPGDVVKKTVKRPFLRKGTGLERFRLRPETGKARVKKKAAVTPLRAPDLSVRPKAMWSKVEDAQVRKINEQLEQSAPIGDQTLYEKQLEKELLIFEALEKKSENASFSSTNSSVLRILSSTPSKQEKKVHWESQSEDEEAIETIETNLEKKDIAEILLRLKSLADSPESSCTSSVTSEDLEVTVTEKRDIGVETDGSYMCEEYDKKMKLLDAERNRVNNLKKQMEQKEREFQKKKREFEDEKQEFLCNLDAEKRKLIKEKQLFQTYKDAQHKPNKKERQEISNLKQEIADLTETLKLKESKNGMTQARLRNQIKQLEKENANLKEEIDKLTKENAKLVASQKIQRKSSDSKILQEINKNVTKLAQQKNTTPKILDTDDSFLEMGKNLQDPYENTLKNQKINGKTENILEDGSKQIIYPNGNKKTVAPNGNLICVQFTNGDKQETNLLDGTVKYFFAGKNITQTTYADGLEVVEFPKGLVEKRYTDGRSEVTLPDGVIQTTFPDGSQETKYTDGSVVHIKNDEKILLLPNGQKEIETKEFKKREYPDGTVKILYPDGTQETKYANGRVRIKDVNGTLILDTQS